VALMRGEIDAIAVSDSGLLDRQAEWLEKGLVDLHVIFAVPRENKHPQFSYLPEIDGFAKTERERKIVTMFRNFSLTGSPFILPPAMPKDRVEIIKKPLVKVLRNLRFSKNTINWLVTIQVRLHRKQMKRRFETCRGMRRA